MYDNIRSVPTDIPIETDSDEKIVKPRIDSKNTHNFVARQNLCPNIPVLLAKGILHLTKNIYIRSSIFSLDNSPNDVCSTSERQMQKRRRARFHKNVCGTQIFRSA